jgi:hypothetical protein
MANEQHIVVWDPTGEFGQGSLLDAEAARRVRIGNKAAVMPVDANLFAYSGAGGFAFRQWGAGIPLAFNLPRNVGPLVLFSTPEQGYIHWLARLVPESQDVEAWLNDDPERHLEGELRLVSDSSQAIPANAPLSPSDDAVMGRQLTRQNLENGGWVLGGRAMLLGTAHGNGGHYPFSLYGRMQGARLEWLALTKSTAAG